MRGSERRLIGMQSFANSWPRSCAPRANSRAGTSSRSPTPRRPVGCGFRRPRERAPLTGHRRESADMKILVLNPFAGVAQELERCRTVARPDTEITFEDIADV